MQQLWPAPGPIDDLEAFVAAVARPAPPGRPWVLVNMIASLDGAIAVAGRSGGLGAPADKAMFRALRAVADVVLVGAGTVRAEGYGPPRVSPEVTAARLARGQAAAPRLAVVTRSLDLDLTAPLFTEATPPPVLVVCEATPAERRRAASAVAEVVVAGGDAVDLTLGLAPLHELGARVVVCEGGPQLNGDLVAADLVDEWDLTMSPILVGGSAARASTGPDGSPRPMRLDALLEGDGLLFTRWRRAT